MKKTSTLKIKIIKIMKLGVLQGIATILLCSMAMAHNNYAQLLDKKINLSVKDVSFEDALNKIEKATNVKFFYSVDQLNIKEKISFDATDVSLRDVLDKILLPYGIQYKVHEKRSTITLKKHNDREESTPAPIEKPGPTNRLDQEPVRGKVTDAATQQPMAGVNVIIKGSTIGTTTDAEGYYSILAGNDDMLAFSFIGYITFETLVNNRSVIDILLEEDIKSLKEVVVNAGYWEVKDKQQTGNISKITAEEIKNQPVTNPLAALQGKMPGVYIQENTGIPGGGFTIQIRGQNSLRNSFADNGNLPFFVIDGVPFSPETQNSNYLALQSGNPLIAINPADIESIEVLKDADATAIYGSRGANGVVLITTKKGQVGKTKVTMDVALGVGGVSNKMEMLNTPEYLEMRKEAFRNDGANPGFSDFDVNGKWDSLRYTDWQDILIGGTANQTNASLSVSGGNANTQFLVSGNFFRQTYVFPGNSSFSRGSSRFNLNHTSENKRFTMNLASSFSMAKNTLNVDYTFLALTLPPNAPALYDSSGGLNWENDTWSNPLALLEPEYNNTTQNLIANVSVGYEILPRLNFRTSLGYTNTNVEEIQTRPLSQYSPTYQVGYGLTGSSLFGHGDIKTWIVEPQLDYSKTVGSGELSLFLGSTFQESVEERQTISARGYTSDALLKNLMAATNFFIAETNFATYRYNAFFGRINYIWKERYIINLTGRRDGSSRFGPGNKFANFGAAGAAWIFTNEPWMDNLSFLSFGKVRTSYGVTGNDNIRDYQYLNSYSSSQYPYNNTTGLFLTRLSNPDYAWETVRKFEAALEVGLAKDRISLIISAYRNRATDQLVGRPLPLITGQSSVQFNLPAIVENTGWEFFASTQNIIRNKFQWSSSVNFTIPKNKIVAFPQIESYPAYGNIFEVGKSLTNRKTFLNTGVDSQTGEYAFTDFDGNGIISSPADMKSFKDLSQSYYGGITNTIIHGRLQLDIFFQFVKQTGRDYRAFFQRPGQMSNQPDVVTNRWQESGDVTDIQRFSARFSSAFFSYSNFTQSDQSIVDASYFRLRNVSLAWQLPAVWMNKIHAQESRIFIQGQNLLTLTNYIGMSPENKTSQGLPPLRIITMGIQLTL